MHKVWNVNLSPLLRSQICTRTLKAAILPLDLTHKYSTYQNRRTREVSELVDRSVSTEGSPLTMIQMPKTARNVERSDDFWTVQARKEDQSFETLTASTWSHLTQQRSEAWKGSGYRNQSVSSSLVQSRSLNTRNLVRSLGTKPVARIGK